MIELTLREVAEIVGGTLHDVPDPEVKVTGTVEFDSRDVGPGGLFLALPGARVDGHEFAATAVRKGAVAVLGARPVGVPAIVVPVSGETDNRVMALENDADGAGAAVLGALGALAAHCTKALAAGGLTVVGVTGSAGKTSTKDLIAAVLRPLGETVAPPGSFNNEIGHPWTALRATPSTRFLVLEMSARGEGHIAALAKVAPPRIGVELNVGTAHLGEFGSREAIARAKGELVEALPADGVAVLNADDGAVAAMASRTGARVVFYGTGEADVAARDVRIDAHARASFTLRTPAGDAPVALRCTASTRCTTRWPPRPSASSAARPSRRSPTHSRPRAPRRRAGWTCSPRPTGSPSSTTPTTPIPTRCAQPCAASCSCPSTAPTVRGCPAGSAAARSQCSVRWASSATNRSSSTTGSAGSWCASTSAPRSVWALPAPSTPCGRAP
ncbi:hypothetical protein MTP03_29930 [Tsukamurella sp. PLM1]|nr:hypothetical protein MTP03_29930 [Tsukamurella sp. PLM1]